MKYAKPIIASLLIITFIILGVFSILEYTREPNNEEINSYMAKQSGSAVKGKSTENDTTASTEKSTERKTEARQTESTSTEAPSTEEILTAEDALKKELIPSDVSIYPASAISGITGVYSGKFYYTELSGYETVSGAPDNIKEMQKAERESTPDFTLTIYKDGRWEFKADSQMGLKMSDDLLKDPGDAEAGLSGIEKIRNIENGHFETGREMAEGSDAMKIYWDGTINKKDDGSGWVIIGTVEVSMIHGSENIAIRGCFSVTYTGKAE